MGCWGLVIGQHSDGVFRKFGWSLEVDEGLGSWKGVKIDMVEISIASRIACSGSRIAVTKTSIHPRIH